jgi:hypothetical protein
MVLAAGTSLGPYEILDEIPSPLTIVSGWTELLRR